MGVGALGAAGGVAAVPLLLEPASAPQENPRQDYELCLKNELSIFEGASARCYGGSDVMALSTRQVMDSRGEPSVLRMTHPTDAKIPLAEIRTCAQFREAQFDGWYAETGREIRREAWFTRACGVLAALADAQAAEHSFFDNGSPASGDVENLAATMSFGEASAKGAAIEATPSHEWRITTPAVFFVMRELANADFDNDGVEEILATVAGGAAQGAAVAFDIGYLEKDGADAPLLFTPITGDGRGAGAAGG